MGVVLDAAVGVRNGQVIDSDVIRTLNVGVVPESHQYICQLFEVSIDIVDVDT